MILKNKITILVCSCDSYCDLWPPFFKLLKKYWSNNECKIILNTETKQYSYPGLNIETFSLGKESYGKRMLDHINRIDTPFVLLLLDDFFLRRNVEEDVLCKLIEMMENNENIAAMTFDENPYYDRKEESYLGFVKLLRCAPYKLNMQAGIWRVDSFKKYWAPNDNPWIWEIFVNYLTYDSTDVFYALKNREIAPIYYGYNTNGMGVYRGKWVIQDVKPLFDKNDIVIDYTKRGIYIPEEAVERLPVLKTMPYVFKRIPFKYAMGFSAYEVWKRFLRIFGVQAKHQNYAKYLASKEIESQ